MKYFYWESIYDEAQTGIQDRRVYHSVICSGNAFKATTHEVTLDLSSQG